MKKQSKEFAKNTQERLQARVQELETNLTQHKKITNNLEEKLQKNRQEHQNEIAQHQKNYKHLNKRFINQAELLEEKQILSQQLSQNLTHFSYEIKRLEVLNNQLLNKKKEHFEHCTKLEADCNALYAQHLKEISHLKNEVSRLNHLKSRHAINQDERDSHFILNFLANITSGEILAYSLLAVVLVIGIAGLVLATWGTGLIGVAAVTPLLYAGITATAVGGTGLLITTGNSFFSQVAKEKVIEDKVLTLNI